MANPHDPITFEIIEASLQAAAEEMFAAMRATAMSSIIYEVLDMGTGVFDRRGRAAGTGSGLPGFISMVDKGVKFLANKFDAPGAIEDGDVFVTNDPYHGGVTHLNDIIVAMPVFALGKHVGWTGVVAHNSDVGGKSPSSISADATEIFQEGLRLPAVKMISRGEPIASVFEIMTVNSRMPDYLEGDIWSAISATRIGGRRLRELAEKYGVETFEAAMDHMMDRTEARVRAELGRLPHGTFEASDEQDDGSSLGLRVTITPDEFVVDLRDAPDQVRGPKNLSKESALIHAQITFKVLTDPDFPANEGSFRPVRVLTREGSIFHAKAPAAIGMYYELGSRLRDLIFKCLAPHVPHRLGAGNFGAVCGTFIGGTHPDTGRHYTIIEPQTGGWGADQGGDGNSAMFNGGGNTFNCPAEIAEARYGLIVESLSLNPEPGGEGRYYGGRGIRKEFRVRSDNSYLTIGYTRTRVTAWPLAGGNPGTPNYVTVIRTNGEEERHAVVSGLRVDAGDIIRITTGNGAGYGDPTTRDPELIHRDLRNGLITRERAIAIHGADLVAAAKA